MQYSYHVADPAGRRARRVEPAESPDALARALESRGYLVLDIAPAREPAVAPTLAFASRQHVLEFTRALAALLPAGLPLARALGAAENLTSGALRQTVAAVRARVERGESLATALGEQQRFFPPIYVGLVRAGERSGDLAGAFGRLASQLEREAALRARLLSAMLYPTLLALVGGVAVVVLLLFVLPRFVEMLGDTGSALPRSTALLLGVSALAREYWVLGTLGLVGLTAALVAYGRTDDGRRTLAGALLRVPLVGNLRRSALAARFARLTGILLGGGAPVLTALASAEDSIGDPVAKEETARIHARVREGVALNAAVAEGTLYPPLLAQLVAVGEESSRLEEFLLKSAEIFEDRTERALQRLVTLAEPAMIVVFGTMVGFVALSLMQAMYGIGAGTLR